MVEKVNNYISEYAISLDKTRHNGILRFTHEITIWLKLDGYKPIFDCASVITPDGWVAYSWAELEEFEHNYPGALGEAYMELREYVEKETENETQI